MASVDRYNRWIFEEIAPYVGQRLLEVGCGIGNMTAYFLDRELIYSIDLLPESIVVVREQFGHHTNLRLRVGDIGDPSLVADLASCRFDTVACLNVLEHIEDDEQALRHMYRLLQPGGHLLLVVPAGRYMFGTLDEALAHYRRYELKPLEALVRDVGFEVVRIGYLNLVGIAGWWLNSRLLKRQLLPKGQLTWFNWLAPVFIRFERLLRAVWDLPWGQSLVCISRRGE